MASESTGPRGTRLDDDGAARPARGTTRARMVDSATVLLRERGASGVTVDAVLQRSGAPRGSVYHHFKGGREEILLAALSQAGDAISDKLARSLDQGGPREAVQSFVRFWKRALVASDFRAGCPAVAVVVDGRGDIPEANETVQRIFGRWHLDVTGMLTSAGYEPLRAGRLATLIVSAIEGAIILCRATHDVRPLDDVEAELLMVLTGP